MKDGNRTRKDRSHKDHNLARLTSIRLYHHGRELGASTRSPRCQGKIRTFNLRINSPLHCLCATWHRLGAKDSNPHSQVQNLASCL